MPSFSTTTGSYNQFFLSIIDNVLYYDDNSLKHTLCRFIQIFCVIVIATLALVSLNIALLCVELHGAHAWDTYNLFWVNVGLIDVWSALISFTAVACMITSIMDTPILYHITTGHRKFLLILFGFVAMVTALYVSTTYIFTNLLPGGATKTIFTKDENAMCQIVLCSFWTVAHIYVRILFPGFLPLILFVVYLLMDVSLFTTCGSHHSSEEVESHSAVHRAYGHVHGGHELELGLLREVHSGRNLHTAPMFNNHKRQAGSSSISHLSVFAPVTHKTAIGWCLLFGVFYGFLWSFRFFTIHIHKNIVTNDGDFEILYAVVLVYTVCCKFILKHLGRKIDKYRIRNSNKNHVLSLEYFFEWLLSVVYYAWFRVNIVLNNPSVRTFIAIFAVHLGTEMIQSLIKFGGPYFSITAKLLQCTKRRSQHSRVWTLLYRLCEDDCDINEWRNRNALDMTLRFYASILVGLVQTYLLLAVGRNAWKVENVQDSIYFGVALVVGELVYYSCIWIARWYLSKYDMLSAFVLFVGGMTNGQRIYITLVFVAVIVTSVLE